MNDTYPDRAEAQKRLLEIYGFRVAQKGKKYLIQNYRDFLAE